MDFRFLLAMAILAHKVRQDNSIKGFRFGDYEIKQILCADDVTLFVKDANLVNSLQLILMNLNK